ncbi:MAG: ArnT family glycosyltransferase [Armatimonadota bacterium]
MMHKPWHTFSYTIVVLAVSVVIVLVSYRSFFAGLSPEACGYAQLSRNIAEGHGMQTSSLPPLSFMHWKSSEFTPDLTHPPLYPLFQAGMFQALNTWDRTAILSSALWFLLLVTVMVVLASRVFGRETGLAAGLLLVMWPPICHLLALSAMPYSMGAVWWCCAWLLLFDPISPQDHLPDTKQTPLRSVLIGLFLALSMLTQTSLWIGCVLILAYLVVTERWSGFSRWGIPIITMLLVLLPWIIRQISVAHTPFFSLSIYETLMETPNYPGDMLYRLYSPGHLIPWWPTSWSELNAVLAKSMRNLQAVSQTNGQLMALLPIAAVGAFYSHSIKQMRLMLLSLSVVLLTVVVYAFGREGCADKAVIPTLPMLLLMAVYGVRQMFDLYDENGAQRFRAFTILAVGICSVYTTAYIVTNRRPAEDPLRVAIYRTGEQIKWVEVASMIGRSCLQNPDLLDIKPVMKVLISPSNALERALAVRLVPRLKKQLVALPKGQPQHQAVVAILNDAIRGGTPLHNAASQMGIRYEGSLPADRRYEGLNTQLPWLNRRIIEAYWPKSIRKCPTPTVARSIGICDQPDLAAWYTETAWVWLPESAIVQEVDNPSASDPQNPQTRMQADQSNLMELSRTKAEYLLLTPEIANVLNKQMLGWFQLYQGASSYIQLRDSLSTAEQVKLSSYWQKQAPYAVIPLYMEPCQSSSYNQQQQHSVLLSQIVLCSTDFHRTQSKPQQTGIHH